MTKYIWAFFIVAGTLLGAVLGNASEVADAVMNSAASSAALCIGMIGSYMLFMGMMNIAKEAGIMDKLSAALKKPLGWLFRGVRSAETMGYIAMNIAANMLGMGNAATPFGLKAMRAMQRDNPSKDSPTEDMCTFLILNTASVQLLPLSIVALRQAAGSVNPQDIIPASIINTLVTAAFGMAAALILRRRSK